MILAAVLAVAAAAVAADTFDFAAVYSDVHGDYGWGYVNDPDFGTTTTNWIGPGNRLYPGDIFSSGGDVVNITTPTNGLTIDLYKADASDGGATTPLNVTLGILNLNAGANGYYHINSVVNNPNSGLSFNNNGAPSQINMLAGDAGNDVINCQVDIAAGLDMTGGKLLIKGPTGFNGTLALHSAARLTCAGPVTVAGPISVDPGTTLTFAGGVAPSKFASLIVEGGGTVELATTTGYTGTVVAESSTLLISTSLALDTADLQLHSSTFRTVTTFSNDSSFYLNDGNVFDTASGTTFTANGPIDGDGGLTKAGGGQLSLLNAYTFTGGVTVNAGTLQVSGDSGLGDPANSIAIYGGTLSTTGVFTTNRNIAVSQGTIDVGQGGSVTIASQITGMTLTKTGAGTLVLAHANSFTGTLAVNGGIVFVSADNALGNAANQLSFNGGALFATSGFTTNRPVFLDMNGGTFGVAGFRGGGDTLTLSGLVSGPGDLAVSDGGAVVLSNSNNDYGATHLFGGALRIASDNVLGKADRTLAFFAPLSGPSAILNTTADIAMSRPILTTYQGTFDVSAATTLTLSENIVGTAGFTKTGAGTLALYGDNTASGGLTDFREGGVIISADKNLGPAGVPIAIGENSDSVPTLYTTASITSPRSIAFGNVSTGVLSPGGKFDVASGTTFVESGFISGYGQLIKEDGGTLVLAAINSYAGGTVINDGVLRTPYLTSGGINSGIGASSNSAANLVLNGGTFQYTGSGASTDRLFTIGALGGTLDASGTGPINFTNSGALALSGSGSRTLTLTGSNTGNNTLAGVVADGTGGPTTIVKTGAGTWVLSGASTYTGTTTVNGGTLGVTHVADGGASSSIGASSNVAANLVLNGGTFQYAGTGDSSDRLFTVTALGAVLDASGIGPVVFSNTSAVVYSGSGSRVLTLTGSNIGNNTLAAVITDVPSGLTALVKNGVGTWALSGPSTYTGSTAVNAGTLTINGASLSSSANSVAAAATMNFVNGANAGSGTFTNSSSASSGVNGGLIQFVDSGTTAGSGIYTNNGGTGSYSGGGSGGNGAQIVFNSGATAGNATITNNGASIHYAVSGGQTLFNTGSTAGNATITSGGGTDPGQGGPAPGGLTLFSGNASAGAATLITNAGRLGGLPGVTEFKDTANGGTANITINSGTYNQFFNDSTAGAANITTNSGAALYFYDSANRIQGTTATLTILGGPAFAPGSETDFFNTSTADHATITVASNQGAAGLLNFHNASDAGHATIMTGTMTGGAVGTTRFYDSSSAANGTFITVGGVLDAGSGATHPAVQFHNGSTGGSGDFTNFGAASSSGASGAELDFLDTSNAGNATIVNDGASIANSNGALTVFSTSAKAGTANITNNPATIASTGNIGGGYTYFNSGTGADHATIISNGGAFTSGAQATAGHTIFNAGSTADRGTFITNGALTNIGQGGEVDFFDGATAGAGNFTNNAGAVSGASGGFLEFHRGGATGANAVIVNNGGAVNGAGGAVTIFADSTTLASAMVTANGGTVSGAGGATIGLFGNPDLATSTLIANGGTNGGAGGLILCIASPGSGQFLPDSHARIIANVGGSFDSSGAGLPLSVGSIEGAGKFLLGGGTLISGSLNTDTTVSGVIANGGNSGGSNGNLTKAGAGKLSLTGANTYSGATTVNAGTLSTSLLANGGVPSGIGSSSSASANLVLNGGTLQYTGPSASTDRSLTLGAVGGALDASGAGPLILTNSSFLASSGAGPRTLTLTGSNTGPNTLAAQISDGSGGSTSVAKTGAGAWVMGSINQYTGPTTITAGALRYGGSDPLIQPNSQAYTLNPANPAGNQTGYALGLDFNVNSGRVIMISQLGVYDDGRNGFANTHTAYIYNRDTQVSLANIAFSVGTPGTISADGYRFLPLTAPLTLSAGNYTVVADFAGPDLEDNNFFNSGQNQGTMIDGGGAISFVGAGRYGSPGSYPPNFNGGPVYTFGAGSFVFSTAAIGRIPGDVTINGPTAVLDLGNNQNGNVATVTLDGGGNILGTGTSTLTSRTSFQLKNGAVMAALAGVGTPLVKSTAGTVTLAGANTYSGDDTISAGTLRFNITSGAPTIASGVTATIAAGATLELAGSVSALGMDGGNCVHIENNSQGGAGPSGVVVSGVHQIVGSIDGSGITQVNAGSDLTANHIVQTALVIGGMAGSPALMTIAASDSVGNPLGQSKELALASLVAPSDPFDTSTLSSSDSPASSGPFASISTLSGSILGLNTAAVPEPTALLEALLAVIGVISIQFARLRYNGEQSDPFGREWPREATGKTVRR